MNERIKELAEQAKDFMTDQVSYLSSIHNRALSTTEAADIFEEKFADLIVRECVTVMYDDAIERKVPPDINQTPTHYAVAVLEHFGVKE